MVRSSALRFIRSSLRRQRYGDCIPQEPGRHTFSSSQLHSAEDSPLGGVSSGCVVASIHHGETQRAGGFLVSPESDPGLRVDSEAGGVSRIRRTCLFI